MICHQIYFQLILLSNCDLLRCTSFLDRGNPEREIKWYRDNSVNSIFSGENFVIESPQVDDSGSYRCQAENSVAQVSSDTKSVTIIGELSRSDQQDCRLNSVMCSTSGLCHKAQTDQDLRTSRGQYLWHNFPIQGSDTLLIDLQWWMKGETVRITYPTFSNHHREIVKTAGLTLFLIPQWCQDLRHSSFFLNTWNDFTS